MRKAEPAPLWTCVSPWVVVAMLGWPSSVSADSRTIAAHVAAQFIDRKLNAFAVQDPNDDDRFIAAIVVDGHVLAVSAVHPKPALVRQKIAAARHRTVYALLITSGNKRGRLFVGDFGTPGLTARRDSSGSCDMTWRDAADEVMFDGRWRAQELSEAEYRRRFATDEEEYEAMLRLLHAALSERGSG